MGVIRIAFKALTRTTDHPQPSQARLVLVWHVGSCGVSDDHWQAKLIHSTAAAPIDLLSK